MTTEGSIVKPCGWSQVPGIWNERQVKAWKKITDKVHANGSYITIQLWNLARQGDIDTLIAEDQPLETPTAGLYSSEKSEKRAKETGIETKELTIEDIQKYVKFYGKIAQNAINAGFDFIEVHSANGYIFDQFFQEISNKRQDKYGGSIENRARFFFEVIDEIVRVTGAPEKLAARFSPWGVFGNMGGVHSRINPIATFGYILSELQHRVTNQWDNKFGYISIVEPTEEFADDPSKSYVNNNWVYDIWKGVVLRTGDYGHTLDRLKKDVNSNDRTLIGIGREYISNPDLPYRLKNGLELNPYDFETFYTHNDWGYNSYGKYGETVGDKEEAQKKEPQPLA